MGFQRIIVERDAKVLDLSHIALFLELKSLFDHISFSNATCQGNSLATLGSNCWSKRQLFLNNILHYFITKLLQWNLYTNLLNVAQRIDIRMNLVIAATTELLTPKKKNPTPISPSKASKDRWGNCRRYKFQAWRSSWEVRYCVVW